MSWKHVSYPSDTHCRNCYADDSYQTETREEIVCTRCGAAVSQIIDQGPGRVFADDPDSFVKSGVSRSSTYNPADFHNSLGSRQEGRRLGREPLQFLTELQDAVRGQLTRLYIDFVPEAVKNSALAHTHNFFHCQWMEKQGLEYKLNEQLQPESSGHACPKRKKFGSKDKIVFTSIYLALPQKQVEVHHTSQQRQLITYERVKIFSALQISNQKYTEGVLQAFQKQYSYSPEQLRQLRKLKRCQSM